MLEDISFEVDGAHWNKMFKQGILPIDVTLGCMIDALVEARDVKQAVALFKSWKPKVMCDTIVYSTLIKPRRCRAGHGAVHGHEADNVAVNHIAYTALINAHTRNGAMATAGALLSDMQQDGCLPNTITYSSLAKGYCACSDWNSAFSLFHKMVGLGLEADAVIFSASAALSALPLANKWQAFGGGYRAPTLTVVNS